MRILQDHLLPYNTGRAFVVLKGQHIRVIGSSNADFVAFDLYNVRHRFDQARTKVIQGKIFLTTGDMLISKDNEVMFTIVEDTFEGTHDLEKGMCSGSFFTKWGDYVKERLERIGRPTDKYPDHGCWENLVEALRPWGIPSEDIPSPFNIFQWMVIDETGYLEHKGIERKESLVEMRAEMDCLVAVSACPEGGLGKEIRVQILGAES